MSERPSTSSSNPVALAGAVALASSVVTLYGGAYAWLRLTHRLVHYSGGCTCCHTVRSPSSYLGLGETSLDSLFAPLLWLEVKLHSFPFWF